MDRRLETSRLINPGKHTSSGEQFTLIVESEPKTGQENMAIDEELLNRATTPGATARTIRIYRWSRPTLSLGYFQKESAPAGFEHLDFVRRLSGGGAILHDREWTYSIVVPPGTRWSDHPRMLYLDAHEAIIEFLAERGVHASFRGEIPEKQALAGEFLCFERGDSFDLVLHGNSFPFHGTPKKILGSAQRRRRGAILQHGSLIVEHSPEFPGIPGILDLLPESHPLERDSISNWGEPLAQALLKRLLQN